MQRAQKETFVKDMQGALDKAEGVLFVDFTGLTVAEADSFRGKMREVNVQYQVVKNTLMKRVLDGTPYESASKVLKGTPTGVVIGFEDPVSPAKALFDFMEDCEHIQVKGGIVDNKAIGAKEAEALSKMPSKEEIMGGIVVLAMSPGRNLAGQIKNPAGRVVGAIESLVERLEASA